VARDGFRVRWLFRQFPVGPQSDSLDPRFHRPPCDPGRSDFPSPVLTLAVRSLPDQHREAQMLTHIHPSRVWFACKPSSCIKGSGAPSSESGPVPEPPSAQSPFARLGRYLRRRDVQHLVRGRYPSFIAHTDSCARPNSSGRLQLSLVRPVFAGCSQPLLEDGPSRRYLHNLCQGAWTLAPPRSCRPIRLTPILSGQTQRPKDVGLALVLRGSARERFPAMQLPQGGYFGAAVIH